jgi:hypothetical protein
VKEATLGVRHVAPVDNIDVDEEYDEYVDGHIYHVAHVINENERVRTITAPGPVTRIAYSQIQPD